MPEDLVKQASTKVLSWTLRVIATGLVAVVGIVFNFYIEWKQDEATEDAEKKILMFDSPEQKEEHKDHVKEAPSALEQKLKIERDADFQKEVLMQLKQMQRMDTLNADQIYQIKQTLEQ